MMEIKVCISVQSSHERFPRYVDVTIDDNELLEWAKRYVSDNHSEGDKAVSIEIESITP